MEHYSSYTLLTKSRGILQVEKQVLKFTGPYSQEVNRSGCKGPLLSARQSKKNIMSNIVKEKERYYLTSMKTP